MVDEPLKPIEAQPTATVFFFLLLTVCVEEIKRRFATPHGNHVHLNKLLIDTVVM